MITPPPSLFSEGGGVIFMSGKGRQRKLFALTPFAADGPNRIFRGVKSRCRGRVPNARFAAGRRAERLIGIFAGKNLAAPSERWTEPMFAERGLE